MARPYSLDLRERVASAVSRGESCRSVSRTFGVSVASVVRWSQRARETGSASAYAMGGRRPLLLAAEKDWLLARFAQKPDVTLHALWPSWSNAERGCAVTRCGGFSSVRGSALKKTVFAIEQDRPDVARKRARWKKYQARLDPTRLVFIDETCAKTNMIRCHGWCARGKPLKPKAPHDHWRTMTFIAALRWDRIDAPLVQDGPINGEWFTAYVRQVLAPTLRPGDIVVMDNLGSHKGKAVRQAIAQGSSSCPPTAPTRTPSNRSSQSSRGSCEKPRKEPSKPHGDGSANSSITSLHKNAPITSGMQAMLQSKSERL